VSWERVKELRSELSQPPNLSSGVDEVLRALKRELLSCYQIIGELESEIEDLRNSSQQFETLRVLSQAGILRNLELDERAAKAVSAFVLNQVTHLLPLSEREETPEPGEGDEDPSPKFEIPSSNEGVERLS